MQSLARSIVADTGGMLRISVVGNSGSGKTTIASAIAATLGVPHLELDAVFHQPDWQPLDTAEFRRIVSEFTAAGAWVVDGNYSKVQDITWGRADTVIWVDPPRHRVMRQLVARTLRRMATRAELWNGNREAWSNLLRLDPEQSILAWAWTNHRRYRDRYLTAQADPANSHLTFVRLRTPADEAALLRDIGSSA
jgi:adenylate kinase family enzyme